MTPTGREVISSGLNQLWMNLARGGGPRGGGARGGGHGFDPVGVCGKDNPVLFSTSFAVFVK